MALNTNAVCPGMNNYRVLPEAMFTDTKPPGCCPLLGGPQVAEGSVGRRRGAFVRLTLDHRPFSIAGHVGFLYRSLCRPVCGAGAVMSAMLSLRHPRHVWPYFWTGLYRAVLRGSGCGAGH